jgi:hypothetical protein
LFPRETTLRLRPDHREQLLRGACCWGNWIGPDFFMIKLNLNSTYVMKLSHAYEWYPVTYLLKRFHNFLLFFTLWNLLASCFSCSLPMTCILTVCSLFFLLCLSSVCSLLWNKYRLACPFAWACRCFGAAAAADGECYILIWVIWIHFIFVFSSPWVSEYLISKAFCFRPFAVSYT